MGGLRLDCVIVNGTRLLGMSYTIRTDESLADDYDYVVLVQSNISPVSLSDITWSLVAVYPRNTYYPQDYSPLVCNVDPKTGVFSAMSYFNLTDPSYTSNTTTPQRPPGGFQYDPRSQQWSNFTLDSSYQWGDHSATFALFQWPNTTTLFQANVGASAAVNIGMLVAGDDGSSEFINVVSWDLDPSVYGYPSRLVVGSNNVLYQFGTLVANNRTGALRNTLTRIPLGGDPLNFQPPTDLPVYNATSMASCIPSYITASYYKDTLYVFCQGVDDDIGPGLGLVMEFHDGTSRSKSLSDTVETDIDRLSGSLIQPIGGDNDDNNGNGRRFAFIANTPSVYPMVSLDLEDPLSGVSDMVSYNINITDPYGFPVQSPPNHTGAIVGGSVAGVLLLATIVLCIFGRRRWPRWKRTIKAKIIDMMTTDEDKSEFRESKDIINKIEEPSVHSMDLDGQGKILVTDDMELHGIMDADKGYMQEVTLQHHPRPAVVTTLTTDHTAYPSHDDAEEPEDGPPLERRPRASRTVSMMVTQRMSSNTAGSGLSANDLNVMTLGFPTGSNTGRDSELSTTSTCVSIPPDKEAASSIPEPPGSRVTHSPSAPRLQSQLQYTLDDVAGTTTSSLSASSKRPTLAQNTKAFKAQEQDNKISESRWSSLYSSPSAEVAPPYSQRFDPLTLSSLSFPTPPTPTAPRWISEEIRNMVTQRMNSPYATVDEIDSGSAHRRYEGKDSRSTADQS